MRKLGTEIYVHETEGVVLVWPVITTRTKTAHELARLGVSQEVDGIDEPASQSESGGYQRLNKHPSPTSRGSAEPCRSTSSLRL